MGSQWRVAAKGWALCLPAVWLSFLCQCESVEISHVLLQSCSYVTASSHSWCVTQTLTPFRTFRLVYAFTWPAWCTITTWAWLESPRRRNQDWLDESTTCTSWVAGTGVLQLPHWLYITAMFMLQGKHAMHRCLPVQQLREQSRQSQFWWWLQ